MVEDQQPQPLQVQPEQRDLISFEEIVPAQEPAVIQSTNALSTPAVNYNTKKKKKTTTGTTGSTRFDQFRRNRTCARTRCHTKPKCAIDASRKLQHQKKKKNNNRYNRINEI